MKRILIFGLLVLALAVFTNSTLANPIARGETSSFRLTNDPCTGTPTATVLTKAGATAEMIANLKRGELMFDGRTLDACWMLHMVPRPHIDLIDAEGDEQSIAVEDFTEEETI